MSGPLPLNLLPDTAEIKSDGRTTVGGCDLVDLAHEWGTPLFVYDEKHLRTRCQEAVTAFGEGVAYASKAFLCSAMAQLAYEEGMYLDVATGGELHLARHAGVPGEKLIFHGNNKSDFELTMAIQAKIGRIVVDSFDELDRLDRLYAETGVRQRILLRVTPGVQVHTHEYVATGQNDSKFGFTVSEGLADKAIQRAASSTTVELVGIHAHIGSQVFDVEPFAKAVEVLAEFAAVYDLPELSVGGGLGVPYVEGEFAPSITEWAFSVKQACQRAGITSLVTAEPGRSIVANAAVTLYSVGTIKNLPGVRTYVAVDGGMSDNPRPVLYGSGYETFLPRSANADRSWEVRVVGKHCESGDVLVRKGMLPADLEVGDILATPVTGAYGYSMGSNYNQVLRPAVIFVSQGNARLVVRRETYEDLIRREC